MSYKYLTPHYRKRAKELKIQLPQDITDDIMNVESLSNNFTEEEDSAKKLDKLLATAIKKEVEAKEAEIKKTEKDISRREKLEEEQEEREKAEKEKQKIRGLMDQECRQLGIPEGSSEEEIKNTRDEISHWQQRAVKTGLKITATKEQIIKSETMKKEFLDRAKAAGHPNPEKATEVEVKKLEAEQKVATSKKEKFVERATAAGHEDPENATEDEVIKLENDAVTAADWAKRAIAVNLPENASPEKVAEEEEKIKTATDARTAELDELNLSADASDDEIEAAKQKVITDAEEAEKAALATEDEKLPANYRAVKKLFDAGKTVVSKAELKEAGFNTGFFGPLGSSGCVVGDFRLSRKYPAETDYTISKR